MKNNLIDNARVGEIKVGDEIRQLRQAKGLTLRDLAKRSNRSLGYLSQIERESVQPSVATLKSIADALGVEMNWFFSPGIEEENREKGVVVRSQSRRRLSYAYQLDTEALGYEDYLVSASLNLDLYMGLSRISPGGKTNKTPMTYENHLSGYVVKGTVTLSIEDSLYVLYEGDSYTVDSRRPHNMENTGDSVAEVVWAITPTRLPY